MNRWHAKRERRAEARPVAHGRDVASMHFHDLTDDRQSEAEATVRTRTGCISLAKRFEHARKEFRVDADARVAHRHLVHRAVPPKRHDDAASWQTELDGVRKQIPDRLFEPLSVAYRRQCRDGDALLYDNVSRRC